MALDLLDDRERMVHRRADETVVRRSQIQIYRRQQSMESLAHRPCRQATNSLGSHAFFWHRQRMDHVPYLSIVLVVVPLIACSETRPRTKEEQKKKREKFRFRSNIYIIYCFLWPKYYYLTIELFMHFYRCRCFRRSNWTESKLSCSLHWCSVHINNSNAFAHLFQLKKNLFSFDWIHLDFFFFSVTMGCKARKFVSIGGSWFMWTLNWKTKERRREKTKQRMCLRCGD